MPNKMIDTTAKVLAGAGAANWGLDKLGFNLLSYLGTGIFSTIALWAIAASGAYVVYLVFKKKI